MNRSLSKTSTRFYRIAFKLLKFSNKLGYRNMMRIGRFIGRRMMQLDANHSRIAAINLDLAQPLLSPQQQRDLLEKSFEHVGMGIMEMAFSWWSPAERFNSRMHIKGLHNLKQAESLNKGIIFVTGHFTTPDILFRFIGNRLPTMNIFNPHQNEFIDRCIRAYRKRNSLAILNHEDIAQITRTLKNKDSLLLNHDEEPLHKQIVFSPFFKVPAATNTAVHRFARMTGAAVVPVLAVREDDLNGYKIIFEAPLQNFPRDAETDCQRLNQIIERWIDKYPEQYDWSQPRFRHRPDGEPTFY